MKKLLLLILFPVFLYAKNYTDKEKVEICKGQLKKDKRIILGLKNLNEVQKAAFRELLDGGIQATLTHENDLFYINMYGEVEIYDLNKKSKVKKIGVMEIEQKRIYQFQPRSQTLRPYNYFSSTFKLGVGIFYRGTTFYPDGAFIYEFFSFDKLFSESSQGFGLSLNLSAGLKHVGVNFGYQFVHSQYFKNTNLMLGYALDFETMNFIPYISVGLGF